MVVDLCIILFYFTIGIGLCTGQNAGIIIMYNIIVGSYNTYTHYVH